MEWRIIDQTYLEGDFRGKYFGKIDDNSQSAAVFKNYDITVYEATIINPVQSDRQSFDDAQMQEGYLLKFLPEVKIEFTEEASQIKTIYQIPILNAYINNPQISDVYQEGDLTFGTISGNVISLIDEKKERIILNPPIQVAIPDEEPDTVTNQETDSATKIANAFSWSDLIDFIFALPIIMIWIAMLVGIIQILSELGPWARYLAISLVGVGVINFFFPGLLRWIFSLFDGVVRKFGQSNWFSVFIFWSSLIFIIWLFNNSYYPLGFTFGGLAILLLWLILFPAFPTIRNILAGISFIFLLFAVPQFIPTPRFVGSGSSNSILVQPTWINASGPSIAPRSTRQQNSEESRSLDPIAVSDSQYICHPLNWVDYQLNEYDADLKVFTADYLAASRFKEGLANEINAGIQFPYFFDQIVNFDQDKLLELEQLLDSVQQVHQLDRVAFAEMIVSLVQSIPYVLLLPDNCDESIITPCLGNVALGVNTPIEFLYTLNGDCDTRVLLLFTILNKYGYEVIVLGSRHYQHALLGIKLPIAGTTINYLGEQFLVWETTSFGWLPGEIPPNCRELKYWEVLLTNYQPI